MRAVGAKTVEVVLRAPCADWRLLFDIVLPRHAVAGQEFESLWKDGIDEPEDEAGDRQRALPPRGLAARQAADAGQEPALLGAAHLAYLDRVVFRFFPPQDTADLLRRGEIDMIDPAANVLQAQALELHRQRPPGIRVDSILGADPGSTSRSARAPEATPRSGSASSGRRSPTGSTAPSIAREAAALNLASAAASRPLDSVVFLANSRYHERNWSAYRYRPARARQLLERAGCRRGADGIYVCDGNRLSLRFVTTAGVPRRELTVRLAQAQLRGGRGSRSSLSSGRPSGHRLGEQPPDARGLRRLPLLVDHWCVDARPRGRLRMSAASELHGLLRSPGDPRPRQR